MRKTARTGKVEAHKTAVTGQPFTKWNWAFRIWSGLKGAVDETAMSTRAGVILWAEPCVSIDRTPNTIFKAAFAFYRFALVRLHITSVC